MYNQSKLHQQLCKNGFVKQNVLGSNTLNLLDKLVEVFMNKELEINF